MVLGLHRGSPRRLLICGILEANTMPSLFSEAVQYHRRSTFGIGKEVEPGLQQFIRAGLSEVGIPKKW